MPKNNPKLSIKEALGSGAIVMALFFILLMYIVGDYWAVMRAAILGILGLALLARS